MTTCMTNTVFERIFAETFVLFSFGSNILRVSFINPSPRFVQSAQRAAHAHSPTRSCGKARVMALVTATTLRATTPGAVARRGTAPARHRNASWQMSQHSRQKPARVSRRPLAVSGDATATVADVDGIIPAFGPGAPQWPVIHADLRSSKFGTVRTVTSEQAAKMLRDPSNPAALADVRPRIEFDEFAAEDESKPIDVRNVPYFVPHRSTAKRWQGYFLCTKDGLKERDPTFTKSFEAQFPDKSAPIVVGCKAGGDITLDPVTIDPVTKRQVFPEGSSQYGDGSKSNSLMAVYELQQAGYTNVFHLEGGITEWCQQKLPHRGDSTKFYFHPTILPGMLFQLIMVEGIVVRSNLAYVKKFHPENFETINQNNAAYGFINDLVANSPINWMFDYYS